MKEENELAKTNNEINGFRLNAVCANRIPTHSIPIDHEARRAVWRIQYCYYHIYGSNRLIAFHSIFEQNAPTRPELDSLWWRLQQFALTQTHSGTAQSTHHHRQLCVSRRDGGQRPSTIHHISCICIYSLRAESIFERRTYVFCAFCRRKSNILAIFICCIWSVAHVVRSCVRSYDQFRLNFIYWFLCTWSSRRRVAEIGINSATIN